MTSPWGTDRELTTEIAAAAIRDRFPRVDARSLNYVGSGWEFDAFLTRDGWLFRFPRRAEAARLFASERLVHELVAPILPPEVRIPRVELCGAPAAGFPYPFAGHRFIAGVPADQLPEGLGPTFAQDLGAALGAIHSIPESAARAAGVGEMEVDDEESQLWLERGVEIAFRLRTLDDAVDRALLWMSRVAFPLPSYAGPRRVIHHDLSREHVLVDPVTGRLKGIIDWTDAILGDPARDFVFLVTWRGWDFAEEVLRSYPMAIDDGFRDRLKVLARLLSTMWLAHASEQGLALDEHIRGVRNAFALRCPDDDSRHRDA